MQDRTFESVLRYVLNRAIILAQLCLRSSLRVRVCPSAMDVDTVRLASESIINHQSTLTISGETSLACGAWLLVQSEG